MRFTYIVFKLNDKSMHSLKLKDIKFCVFVPAGSQIEKQTELTVGGSLHPLLEILT